MAGRRDDVFAALRAASGPMSIGDIADRLSIHPNTARFHLEALTRTGRVETVDETPAKPGRPPLMFRAVPGMDPAGPRDYRMLANILLDAIGALPDPAASAAAAARSWVKDQTPAAAGADQDRSVDQLIGLLDKMGFAPEKRSGATGAGEIGLRNCPFLELAAHRRDVICPAHLGLMQGAMATWNAPVTVDDLTPFAEPDLCIARLAPVGATQ